MLIINYIPFVIIAVSFEQSPDERKMSMTDGEALAVVANLIHFKNIIRGHHNIVLTGHRALLDLFNKPDLSPKRTRWYPNYS